MSAPFNPYHKWLGIAPGERSLNHYRLLGLDLFESDPDVIESASDQRMTHLRSFQSGQHAALSQKLLNEVAAARLCLLKPAQKARYDEALRKQLETTLPTAAKIEPDHLDFLTGEAEEPAAAADADFVAAGEGTSTASASRSTTPRSTPTPRRRSRLPLLLLIGGPIVGIAAVFVAIAVNNSSDDAAKSGNAANQVAAAPAGSREEPPEKRLPPGGGGSPAIKSVVDPTVKAGGSAVPTQPPATNPTATIKPPPSVPPTDKPPVDTAPIISPTPPATPGPTTVAVAPKSPSPETKTEPAKPAATPPATSTPVTVTPPPAPVVRVPAPDAVAQQKAILQLKEVLKDDFAGAKATDTQKALAAKLKKLTGETKNDPVMCYAMYVEGLELAFRCGDMQLATDLAHGLDAAYETDVWEVRSKLLAQLSHTEKAVDARTQLATAAIELVTQALADDRYDSGVELAASALVFAGPTKDTALHDRAREASDRAKRMQRAAKEAATATERLATDPDNPPANLAVGKFKCFLKDDWKAGLPYLVKGSDEALKEVAKAETPAPTKPDDQMKLADAWWDFVEKKSLKKDDPMARAIQARAVYWYKLALPGLTGLPLAKVQKRVESAAPLAEPGAPLKNVLTERRGSAKAGASFEALGPPGTYLVGMDFVVRNVTVNGAPPRSMVVGIRPLFYSKSQGPVAGEWHGAEPIQSPLVTRGGPITVLAKKGYVVGGVIVKTGQTVDGVSVIFVRVKGTKLDPRDTYQSDWVGSPGGPTDTKLGGTTAPAVGIHGSENAQTFLFSLGLILAPTDEVK